MTFLLVAFWIVGYAIKWYWFLAAVALDVVWMSIKLNFLTVLIRRSIEAAREDDNRSNPPNTP